MTSTGWRVWTLRPDGTFPRSTRDRYGSPLLWADCPVPHEEAAPAPDCVCGLSLVPDLANLHEAIQLRPWTLELHPLRALQRGRNLLDAIRTSHRPDLLGYCTSHGDVQPSASPHDPPGTLRCEALRVEQLCLFPHVSDHVQALALALGREPMVTTLEAVTEACVSVTRTLRSTSSERPAQQPSERPRGTCGQQRSASVSGPLPDPSSRGACAVQIKDDRP